MIKAWRWDENNKFTRESNVDIWNISKPAYVCLVGEKTGECTICHNDIHKEYEIKGIEYSFYEAVVDNLVDNQHESYLKLISAYTYSRLPATTAYWSFKCNYSGEFKFSAYADSTNTYISSYFTIQLYKNGNLLYDINKTKTETFYSEQVESGDLLEIRFKMSSGSPSNTINVNYNIKFPAIVEHSYEWSDVIEPTCSNLNSILGVCSRCGTEYLDYAPHIVVENICDKCNQEIFTYRIEASSYLSAPGWQWLADSNSFECNYPNLVSWSGYRYLYLTFNKKGTLSFDYYNYFGYTTTNYGILRITPPNQSYENLSITSDLNYRSYSLDVDVGDTVLLSIYKSNTSSSGTGNSNYGARIKNITLKEDFN